MITCKNCKINIDSAFSHSIATNSCPACGEEIMDQEKAGMLAYIMQTMSSQSFSKSIDSKLLNEISTFIFTEFLDVEESDEVFEEEDLIGAVEEPAEEQQFDGETPFVEADEDLDDKAARLVEKYRADQRILSSKRKTGVSVRRVST